MRCALAAVAMLISSSFATAAPVEWTFETQTHSSYLGADIGKILHDGAGQQSSITAAWDGWVFNYWNWYAFGSRTGNYGESDYQLDKFWTHGIVTFDVGVSYFDLPKQFNYAGDIVQLRFGASMPILKWQNHLVEMNAMVAPHLVEADRTGAIGKVGVSDTITVTDWLTVVAAARVSYDTGLYHDLVGWTVRGDLASIFHVTNEIDLKVGLAGFTGPYGRTGEVWGGIVYHFKTD